MKRAEHTMSNRLYTILLALIVVLFAVVGALYAIYTPPWQTPDEPAHYNYIAQVFEGGCCPVIEPGDWDATYLEDLKASQFPEDADLSPIAYEDHQPPLYYLLAKPVYRLCKGYLLPLRLLSVLLGAGVVALTYCVVVSLLPGRRVLALAAATFVAFLPQHVAMMASVNNDSLAELLMALTLLAALRYVGNPPPAGEGETWPFDLSRRTHAAVLGVLVGAAYLTKLTIYLPATLVVAAAIVQRWRGEGHPARWLAAQTVWAGGLALAIGGVWWARNVWVYGWPDIFGQAAHSAVVAGQLRTADYVAMVGPARYALDFVTITYHSYWGQFGWMGVPMPPRTYLLIGLFSVWNVAGLAALVVGFRDRLRLEAYQRAGMWLLAAAVLATLANYLYYNVGFVQFQGRYLFTALIPFGLLVALGGWGWSLLLGRWLRDKEHLLEWLPLIGVAWMPLLALWALARFIVPNLG
jgi:4-amino-4-deoxy-L-arabinose transferase-like glycosyltransferase